MKSDLLKSWSLGVGRGHSMGNYFTVVLMGKGGGQLWQHEEKTF
jgi:hypothetical protein